MLFSTKYIVRFVTLLMICLLAFVSACNSTQDSGSTEGMEHNNEEESMEMEHNDETMEMEEDGEHNMAHDHDSGRLPNDGAVIKITAPKAGEVIKAGDSMLVKVEIENFTLDDDGSHWHIYIDGNSWGMVLGDKTKQALRGLEPGHHEISTYLAIGSHEELETGAKVTIMVEE